MVDTTSLLLQHEGKTLEFKRDLSLLKPILKTIIAFANTAGGILVIGRSDDGDILGVEDVFLYTKKMKNLLRARVRVRARVRIISSFFGHYC